MDLQRLTFRRAATYTLGTWRSRDGVPDDDGAILVPASASGLTPKYAPPELAALLRELTTGGHLPQTAVHEMGDRAAQRIAALLYDGIVEVHTAEGWRTGPLAAQLIDLPELGLQSISDEGPQANPARAALLSACRDWRSPTIAARMLYQHGRHPWSAKWTRLMGGNGSDHLRRWYGLTDPSIEPTVARYWSSPKESPGWWYWHGKNSPRATRGGREVGPNFKVYVCVHPRYLPGVLHGIIDTIAHLHPIPTFKLASSARAMLRADRMILYFPTRSAMDVACSSLSAVCSGAPAEPLAFAGTVRGCAALAWGVDPPAPDGSRPWRERNSWRWWLCELLGIALGQVRQDSKSKDPEEVVDVALRRVALEGVDTRDWRPTRGLLSDWGEGNE